MALLLPVALLGLFYVFLILPKQRELKRHNALVASLEVGDEVMTGSGFYGTLTEVGTDTVRVLLAPGLEVTLARRAVAAKVPEPVALDEVEDEAATDEVDRSDDADVIAIDDAATEAPLGPDDVVDPGEHDHGADGPGEGTHDGEADR